jgi:hypothetical protein
VIQVLSSVATRKELPVASIASFVVRTGVITVPLGIGILIVLPLYCSIYAWRTSPDDFIAIGSNRNMWVVLPLIFGLFSSLFFLAAVRPKLKIPFQ